MAQAEFADAMLVDEKDLNGDGLASLIERGRPGIRHQDVIGADIIGRCGTAPERQFFWLPEALDTGATLLIKASAKDGTTCLVVLGFVERLAACQRRLGNLAAPLGDLIAVLLRLEAEKRELKQQQAAAIAALDNLDYGFMAVRSDHTPLLMNRVVRTMLAGESALQLHRGRIRLRSHHDAVRFHVGLDSIVAPPSGAKGRPTDALMMLLADEESEGSGGGRAVLLIAPAYDPSFDIGVPEAAALIYIFRPSVSDVRGLEPLCELLGLSGAETRLVAQLLSGHTVSEAAVSMRIKLETARSYLKQVFAKTGTHRQTDLVAMLCRYLLTIRGRRAVRTM